MEAEKRINLKFGKSIEPVPFQLLIDLLDTGYQRVNIDTTDINIECMVEGTSYFENIKQVPEENVSESLMYIMVNQGYADIVEKLTDLGAVLPNGSLLLEIAWKKGDLPMLDLLLKFDKLDIME